MTLRGGVHTITSAAITFFSMFSLLAIISNIGDGSLGRSDKSGNSVPSHRGVR